MEEVKFQPFDKVLVRNEEYEEWKCSVFTSYKEEDEYPYKALGDESVGFRYCILFNDETKHLVGTTDDPPQPKPEFKFGDKVEGRVDGGSWKKGIYLGRAHETGARYMLAPTRNNEGGPFFSFLAHRCDEFRPAEWENIF